MDNRNAKEFYSSKEWRKLKERAYKRYGRKCMATGLTEKDGITLSVDKIIPRSKAPHLALKLSNVQVLELGLNKTKSNRANWDFRPLRWKFYYFSIRWIKRLLVALSVGILAILLHVATVVQTPSYSQDLLSHCPAVVFLSTLPDLLGKGL